MVRLKMQEHVMMHGQTRVRFLYGDINQRKTIITQPHNVSGSWTAWFLRNTKPGFSVSGY
jgi:hypothetical protein